MAIDPLELAERTKTEDAERETQRAKAKDRLNNLIAVTIAILATFLGLCQVKAGNVAQAMQMSESDRVNAWAWYQARNIREEIMLATANEMEVLAKTASPAARPPLQALSDKYRKMEQEQLLKQKEQQKQAEDATKRRDQLNVQDDQFDLCEAFIAIAIALLALCALTERRWLYHLALVPSFFGVLMGLAGLFGLPITFSFLSKFLGA